MNKLSKVDLASPVAGAAVLSLDYLRAVIAVHEENEKKKVQIESHRQWFLDGSVGFGYSTPEEFLKTMGFIKTGSTKGTRKRIDPVTRESIVQSLKLGKPTSEIANEFGVTPDSVYSIKSKAGLSTPRKKVQKEVRMVA